LKQYVCDVLVIGGGAAACRAAYEAKKLHPEMKVLMAVAGVLGTSGSTNLIASESLGINAPFNFMKDGDSPDVHYQDMIETGEGLSDPRLCRIIADESCDRVQELMDLGLKFDEENGHPVQRKLSGCTKARSLTCGGTTGREMVKVLKREILRLGGEVMENIRILNLIQDDHGRVRGAIAFLNHIPLLIGAKAVILATGGAGGIFRHHVNPPSLEGDGWCMAFRAGARLINMEFFQIGPAVLKPKMKFIIHSHMWRLHPRLTNRLDEEFLPRYCPSGVSPDQVLSLKAMSYPFSIRTAAMFLDLAIFKEVMAGRGTSSGGVFFDVTRAGQKTLEEQAPITYRMIKQAGADLSKERIEVGLVVQNFNGGIYINADGFTGVEGLYAAGEVTGGVHGADRPGGNNLIDTQVLGFRAGRAAAEHALEAEGNKMRMDTPAHFDMEQPSQEDEELIARSTDLYYSNLTIVRTKAGLEETLQFIDSHHSHRNLFVQNRLLLGAILAISALTREESRGTHYREDFPQKDPAWAKRVVISGGHQRNPVAEILG
jgi:succinate dehydrogenase/fumarate reductase flavoprotein subunit